MNKNRKMKRKIAASVAVGMSVMMGVTPAFAASGTSDSDVYKEETVYVNAKASGKTDKVTVSNWLKNSGSVSGNLEDESTLSDIKNVKGDEKYTADGDKLTWSTDSEDIYYQGTTDKKLPVSVKLKYYLDGKEMKPSELKGKNGHLKITVDYKNNEKKNVSVDGKDTEVYTPFVMMTGMILPNETFSNVTIDNGKIISDGNKNIVVGFGMPGLKDSLNLSSEETDKVTIPESLSIEADVKDFTMSSTYTVALSDLLDDVDMDSIVNVDDLQNALDDLEDAALQLVSGSDTLADGAGTLADGVNTLSAGLKTYTSGVSTLAENNSALTGGTSQLAEGAKTLASGAEQLASGTKTLHDGTSKLVSNNNKLNSGAEQLSDGAGQIQDGSSQLYDGSKELGDGMTKLEDGSDTLATSLGDGAAQVKETKASDDTISMFATPITDEETKITTVENNGHAMAPYMMSVGLWVGCLAFCLMYPLTEYKGKLKSGFAWWASKASVLYPVAILQGVLLILLLHVFDGFTPVEMTKTILFAALTGACFTSIMYFFNITFGKVGSFLMLIFMVVQLAGSAGTYPVEISPDFVAKIHYYLPFTYTVNAFRSTICGGESIHQSVVVLIGLTIIFSILTILQFNHMARRKKQGKMLLLDWLEEKGVA